MSMRAARSTGGSDQVFQGSMARFLQISTVAFLMEAVMLILTINAYRTIPAAGDLTYRYICVGVPGFWAVVIPLLVGGAFMAYNGQSITLGPKAFIFRRKNYTVMLPWPDLVLGDVDTRKWDPNFTASAKGSFVVVRALFFPDYAEILAAVELRLKNRERNMSELRL